MNMNREDAILEDAMRVLAPARVDARLLGRLHAALDEASMPVDEADMAFEAWLSAARPASVPAALIARLEDVAALEMVEMPVSDRIIPFRRYAAAAAVALIGAVAAFLVPVGGVGDGPVADAEPAAPIVAPMSGVREFIPAGYARGLSDARDEGVVWKDNAPHRVLRIVYTDTITLRNESGEIVEVERPRVEYIVLPKKLD